jgi:hypothetical protein
MKLEELLVEIFSISFFGVFTAVCVENSNDKGRRGGGGGGDENVCEISLVKLFNLSFNDGIGFVGGSGGVRGRDR